MQKKVKLTSVEVDEELFTAFKSTKVIHKTSFKEILDRSIYLFIKDEDFRKKIKSQLDITL